MKYQKKTSIFLVLLLFSSVFVSAQWMQIGDDLNGDAPEDYFGISVSLSGDGGVVAIGAPSNDGNGMESGQVKAFENKNDVWVQLGEDIYGEEWLDFCGDAVSLNYDGSIMAIGATFNSEHQIFAGHVRVFEYVDDNWVQIGEDIEGEAPHDMSGGAIDLSSDGNRIAIGALFNCGNGVDAGHVRVFENQESNWVQIGSDIDGDAPQDHCGNSVSLSEDGSMIAVAAVRNSENGYRSGQVRIYEFKNDSWVQLGSDINGQVEFEKLGISVSLINDGLTIAVGSSQTEILEGDHGVVRVYTYLNESWIQKGGDIVGEEASVFGSSIVSLSADGLIIAIGVSMNDGNGPQSGHVRVFQFFNDTWVQIGCDMDGEAAGDKFGNSISLSSDGATVAVGGWQNDGNGDYSGHVRIFNFLSGMQTHLTYNHIKAYPNPTRSVVTINIANTENVRIYNSDGVEIETHITISDDEIVLNLDDVKRGLYIVAILTKYGVYYSKILKQ